MPPLTEDEILAFKAADTAVSENLRAAIKAGAVRRTDDGGFELTGRRQGLFLEVRPPRTPSLGCRFLNAFMFEQVYAKAAVPIACEACYKIKVSPRSLRELVAGYEIAKTVQCLSKWGVDINNQYSQTLYAGYYYFTGLEAARALFAQIRKAVDEHPKLGADVPVAIKRGCSNFEAALGPSDTYTFRAEQREIEAYFKSRYRSAKAPQETLASMLYGKWIPLAFRIGDDTYLDFTGGKPLYPKSLTYAP